MYIYIFILYIYEYDICMLVDILIILSACPGKPSSRRAFFSVGSHFKASGDEHWGTWKSPLTLTPPLDGSGLGSKVLKLRGPFYDTLFVILLWSFHFSGWAQPQAIHSIPYLWALATCIRYTYHFIIFYMSEPIFWYFSLPRDLYGSVMSGRGSG